MNKFFTFLDSTDIYSFLSKPKPVLPVEVFDPNEQLLIEKVIEIVRNEPEKFSARWFTGMSLDDSVKSIRSRNKMILIMKDGQITMPIYPKMKKEQMQTLRELIQPIIKRDMEFLINDLLKS